MRCTGELPNPGVTPPLIGRLQLCIQFQRFLSLLKGFDAHERAIYRFKYQPQKKTEATVFQPSRSLLFRAVLLHPICSE